MKFFKIPPSRELLRTELQNNYKFSSIWLKQSTPAEYVNAQTTLPKEVLSKQQIFLQVEKSSNSKGVSLKWKQGVAYFKILMGFYKDGIKNVWKNNKQYRLLRKQLVLSNYVDNSGVQKSIRIPSFKTLTTEMANHLYMKQVEQQGGLVGASEANMVKRTSSLSSLSPQFNLTRLQYQLIRRTPSDILKIPFFAIIMIVFGETTPLLCYALPEITPYTCVLPTILPRLWNPKASIRLRDMRISELECNPKNDLNHLALRTAYNLPRAQLHQFCQTLRLTNKYIPGALYPEMVLRRRLQAHYNFLVVDDSYLSQDGNLWKLSDQELVLACLERNIILDIKEDAKLHEIETLQGEGEMYYEELRLKLLTWLMDFSKYNIGYVGLNHVAALERVADVKRVTKWWEEDNKH